MLALLVGVLAAGAEAGPSLAAGSKPHIVYVLADDYGHFNGGWGPHGSLDAPTPVLNRLAAEGVVLDRYYVYKFCSPTRSSFLSGRLPIHVNTANRPLTQSGGVDLRMTLVSEQLQSRGYFTSVAGKWHGGARFEGQLPVHRGFNRSFAYLNGMEDHYTQFFDELHGYDLFEDNGPAIGKNGTYGALQYTRHHLESIEAFSSSGADALFLYAPFQNTHSPYEMPPDGYANTSVTTTASKQIFFAMISVLDQAVGNITNALAAKGMWNSTLLVFSADNGGEQAGAGNNFPLRGGKYTDLEGGVRVTAFASGGVIPPAVRGTTSGDIIAIADMWATFSALAGADPVDRKAMALGGVPPIDSVDVSAVFATPGGKSGRDTITLSATAVVKGSFKLVHESAGGKNKWVGPEWPAFDSNGSAAKATPGPACAPCLFDVVNDTREMHDLSSDPRYASVAANLQKILNGTVPFQTGDDGYSGGYDNCTSVDAYKATHADFLGPLCYSCSTGPCPSPPPPPPPPPSGARMLLKSSSSGMCLQSGGDREPVTVAPCSGAAASQRWLRGADGSIVPTSGVRSGKRMCLRPTNPPMVPASCMVGHSVMVGLNACLALTPAGQLASPNCTGLCAAPSSAGSHVALEPCGQPHSEWAFVNATLHRP